MFLFTRVPFWVPIFDPQKNGRTPQNLKHPNWCPFRGPHPRGIPTFPPERQQVLGSLGSPRTSAGRFPNTLQQPGVQVPNHQSQPPTNGTHTHTDTATQKKRHTYVQHMAAQAHITRIARSQMHRPTNTSTFTQTQLPSNWCS